MKISVKYSDDSRNIPLDAQTVRQLVSLVCQGERIEREEITIIFINSTKMEQLNAQFLNHHYPTDVLSFILNEPGKHLEGEVYVCPETARKQAVEYNVPVCEELMRLVIHGILHLAGYDDTTNKDRKKMLEKGDTYLSEFIHKVC